MFNEIDYDFNVAEQAEKCVNWARDYMNNINPKIKLDIVRMPCYDPELPDYFLENYGL